MNPSARYPFQDTYCPQGQENYYPQEPDNYYPQGTPYPFERRVNYTASAAFTEQIYPEYQNERPFHSPTPQKKISTPKREFRILNEDERIGVESSMERLKTNPHRTTKENWELAEFKLKELRSCYQSLKNKREKEKIELQASRTNEQKLLTDVDNRKREYEENCSYYKEELAQKRRKISDQLVSNINYRNEAKKHEKMALDLQAKTNAQGVLLKDKDKTIHFLEKGNKEHTDTIREQASRIKELELLINLHNQNEIKIKNLNAVIERQNGLITKIESDIKEFHLLN